MKSDEAVANREVFELGLKWEGPGVPFAHVPENTRCWIHGCEVENHAEAIRDRNCCKLLQLSGDHCFAINNRHATDESIEAS